jgi:hypothetical protein
MQSETGSSVLTNSFSRRGSFVTGWIVRLNDGVPIVDYPDNPGDPREARVAVDTPREFDHQAPDRFPVLLLVPDDQSAPLIVGFIRDRLSAASRTNQRAPVDVVLDGRRMVFTASQEIVLRCGKGSIYLGRDGKIVVKGVNIISRASGANKVRGAAVKIN